VTALTDRYTGPLREQALNGNGMNFAPLWLGGKTRRPAAVTGRQVDDGKLPTCTIRSAARAVTPFEIVIERTGVPVSRDAARPS